jgi:hypothetical protein
MPLSFLAAVRRAAAGDTFPSLMQLSAECKKKKRKMRGRRLLELENRAGRRGLLKKKVPGLLRAPGAGL